MTTSRRKVEERFHANMVNDPLLGTQEHPDDLAEQLADPPREAAEWPTHGRAEKSRLIAGLLGIFLGAFGAHRFYLHFTGIGAFQLMLFAVTIAFTVAYGIASGMDTLSMGIIALGTAAPVFLWGIIEGSMILGGLMPHDGHAHPLR